MRHCSPSAIFSQFAQNKKLYTFLIPSADRACIGKHCSKYMGMATRLYGCIVEFGSDPSIRSKIYNHNRKVINGLPQADKWPPLTRNMFTITHNMKEPSPNYAYSGRLIHFGANFKSVEYEWEEWKAKFEKFLTRLFWLEADVHFKTEYSGIQSFTWYVDLSKWYEQDSKELHPIQKQHWIHEEKNNWKIKNVC